MPARNKSDTILTEKTCIFITVLMWLWWLITSYQAKSYTRLRHKKLIVIYPFTRKTRSDYTVEVILISFCTRLISYKWNLWCFKFSQIQFWLNPKTWDKFLALNVKSCVPKVQLRKLQFSSLIWIMRVSFSIRN